MARIVNNRICYANHNVLLDPTLHRNLPNYVLEMEDALTPDGTAEQHKKELEGFNNDGSWEVELPTITITPMWTTEAARMAGELPARMLAVATLSNGNRDEVIFTGHCARHESFYPLYGAMSQRGIDVGRKARREAETEYFKQYDAIVAATNPTKE